MNIWEECRERFSPEPISNELIRIVESQEQVATNSIVDDLEEQIVLEHMLETTKPAIPHSGLSLHYLLATPFRYPPLQFGSRFGSRHEPGIFYGSLTIATALTETAYYRLVFWRGMSEPPPSGKFVTQHTAFAVLYKTDKGVKLQKAPFSDYRDYLADPADHLVSQKLGAAMRESGIEAFEYISARDPQHGLNAGLFVPSALACNQPLYQHQWLCETRGDTVVFSSVAHSTIQKFTADIYHVNGQFPHPSP